MTTDSPRAGDDDPRSSQSPADQPTGYGTPADPGVGYAVPTDPAAYYEARWGYVAEPTAEPVERRSWVRSASVALATAIVVAALGFPLGRLWFALSPQLTIKASGNEFFYTDIYGSQWAAWESLYVIISIATGIIVAILSWVLLRRFRGPFMAVGLGLGSAAAGWFIWRVGRAVGRSSFEYAIRHPVNGETLKAPIDLRIQRHGLWHGFLPYIGGNLTYMAIAALATYCLIAGFSTRSDLNVPRKRAAATAVPTSVN